MINKITSIKECKIKNCKNLAKYQIDLKNKLFGPVKIYVCEKCLQSISQNVLKQTIPKSPKNILMKDNKI